MTAAPLAAAGPAILVHLASTIVALLLGIVMLLRGKGTVSHKRLGWAWVILMAVAAGSSFFITGLNPGGFSPIHILSVVTLVALPWAIYAIRRRNLQSHRWTMISIFTGGLVVAGIFTLLPGRLLGGMIFGG
ncbi:MAG TPA: DUF2306 domain-containing protein [Ferrovibrio sp.]|jgi:uncharacterized membrane protein|uniref:DUF2306 domain-containing protein n=1 Tax=Ferrovibrio sp. TaxID=1917215 RepID=UPI002B4B1A12|nr:DUF2306 domain-containing protein [Ferrovibrio sp.]HLT76874.1 DUF2306 domain-containing protein [Ferrovibrio sp.]